VQRVPLKLPLLTVRMHRSMRCTQIPDVRNTVEYATVLPRMTTAKKGVVTRSNNVRGTRSRYFLQRHVRWQVADSLVPDL